MNDTKANKYYNDDEQLLRNILNQLEEIKDTEPDRYSKCLDRLVNIHTKH